MIVNIETCDGSTGFDLCIYPRETRRRRASWILWVAPDGSGQLYTKRKENGAVIDRSRIELPASVARKERLAGRLARYLKARE